MTGRFGLRGRTCLDCFSCTAIKPSTVIPVGRSPGDLKALGGAVCPNMFLVADKSASCAQIAVVPVISSNSFFGRMLMVHIWERAITAVFLSSPYLYLRPLALVCCYCMPSLPSDPGQSADAAVRLQRHFGEHPAEPVGAVRDCRRSSGRPHPTRNKGKKERGSSSSGFACVGVVNVSLFLG